MDCGGGGISGGCRFTTGYFSVLTCRRNQIVCVYINTCSNAVLHMQEGGLIFSNKIEFHTNFNPVSISAGLMYNPGALGSLTPPAFQRTRLLVEVNDWTG